MATEQHRTVELPDELVARIERRRRQTGFESVEEYVTFVLEQVLRSGDSEVPEEEESQPVDSEEVRKKLEALGYL